MIRSPGPKTAPRTPQTQVDSTTGEPGHVHSSMPGNGRAIGNYLRRLAEEGVPPDVFEARHETADKLGELGFESGWAEGTHCSGLSVALQHQLSFDEANAIQLWTNYRDCVDVINPCLRTGEPVPEGYKAILEPLLSGLKRLPPHQGRVYRGTSLPRSIVEELKTSGSMVDPGVLATSKRRSSALQFIPRPEDGFVQVILTIDCKRGRDISLVGCHRELREVELLPNTKLKLVSMAEERGILSGNRPLLSIHLEEVD